MTDPVIQGFIGMISEMQLTLEDDELIVGFIYRARQEAFMVYGCVDDKF